MSSWNNYRSHALTGAWIVALCVILFLAPAVTAQSEPVTENFELGDGVNPFAAGTGDVVGASLQNGPDWDDLFSAAKSCKDVYDEFGNPGSNGMPDFLDTWGRWKLRRDAGFVIDDVSGGTGADGTVFDENGALVSAAVAPAYDVGNAYVYSAFTNQKELIVYAGLERLSVGTATVVFELNHEMHRVVDGAIEGGRTVGDARFVADFGASGLTALELLRWDVIDPATGAAGWISVENLPIDQVDPAEQCNAGQTLCVVSNAEAIAGGSWQSYGADGATIGDLAPNTFVEFGANLSALIGVQAYENFYETRYTSIQITSYDGAADPAAIDYAIGNFARASRLAQ